MNRELRLRKTLLGRTLVASLPWLAMAACGGDGPSGPPVPAEVVVSPRFDTLTVTGATRQFAAQLLNKKGKAVSGGSVTWLTTAPKVATIDSTGLATAVGGGVTQIQARSGGVWGSTFLWVVLEPAAADRVAGQGQTGFVGEPLADELKVMVLDGAGSPIGDLPVTFSVVEGGGVVAPPVSRTGADGIASSTWILGPVAGEPQRVVAAAGEVSIEFSASAVWAPPSVVTTALDYGRRTVPYAGVLRAAGGSGVYYGWSLAGGELPVGVTLSPTGELTGTPAEAGSYSFTVRVEGSEGNTATRDLTLLICEAPTLLEPGESLVAAPSGLDACGFFLPTGEPGDRYRVGIVRTRSERDYQDVAGITLNVRGLGVESLPPPDLVPHRMTRPFEATPGLREAEEIARATEAYHRAVQEEEQAFVRSLPPGVSPLRSVPPSDPVSMAARAQGAPHRRLLYHAERTCEETAPRPAFLLAENAHIAVYQDSAQQRSEPVSPAAVQAMLDYYRDYGKPVIDGYFGGLSDVNGDGQVVVYVTPGIGEGVAGFVRSSDMLPRSSCPSSNEMEITYVKASFINGYVSGNYQPVGTLVHEVKHISSLYKRLVNRDFHPSWLEEGTAEIATDRASRLAISAIGGPSVGAMLTGDDVLSYGSTVEGFNTLLRLRRSLRYIASQPNAVTVNPEGASYWTPSGRLERHTIYGAGWHFHRWLGDAYGNAATPFADTTLFRIQNDSLTPGGPDSYPLLVGKTFPELMEEYALAVMLNGTGSPVPDRPFTSVDFPSATGPGLIYSTNYRPPGFYPWPVTTTGTDAITVTMETAVFAGPMGESGIRVHDLSSNGTGLGAEITVEAPSDARVIVVRIR